MNPLLPTPECSIYHPERDKSSGPGILNPRHKSKSGFTLIELSIVLVIIGLIIGGILAGQNLIDTAAQRAQIAQIEKYNTAVRTFQNKYGGLPGDLPNPYASQFGFGPRGAYAGEGDGNGIIEGIVNITNGNIGSKELAGETTAFWEDLSTAGLIDGTFNTASESVVTNPNITSSTSPSINQYFPQAKIGNGNYIYVWSGGWVESTNPNTNGNSINYYGLSSITSILGASSGLTGRLNTNSGLTVIQAYNIDKKIDDGLPQSGQVLALHLNGNISGYAVWAAGGSVSGAFTGYNAPTTAATPYATTNCFDNATISNPSGVAGIETYSIQQNAGMFNCALSFQFQ